MKSVKNLLRRICSGILALAMVLTLMPAYSQNVYAEEADPVTTPDDTIIATTDDGSNYNNTLHSNNPELFYELAALTLDTYKTAADVETAVGAGTVVTLKYGDVKNVTEFSVTEDKDIHSLQMLDQWLPNLEKLTVKSTKFSYSWMDNVPKDIKSLSIDVHGENAVNGSACTIQLSDLSGFENLETFDVCVDYIYFDADFDLPDHVKKLALADTQDYYSDLQFVATEINTATDLESLELSGQSYAKDVSYESFTNLKTLILQNCGLDTTTFPDLKGLENLDTLSVAGNEYLSKSVALKKVPEKFANSEEWVRTNFTDANEFVTTGEEVSDYYVPDQNLYAVLLQCGDRDKDGMLTVGEAAAITSLYGSVYGVKDWTGLATVAQNLNSVSCTWHEATWGNYYSEIQKLAKLRSLSVCVENETELADVFKMVNLTSLSLTIKGMESVELTGISALTQLEYLSLNHAYDSNTEISVNVSALNEMSNLKDLSIYGERIVVSPLETQLLNRLKSFAGVIRSNEDAKIIKELTNATSMNLTFYGESAYNVDLSDMNSLTNISLRGYLAQVKLPTNAEKLWSVDIYNTGVAGYTDVTKLAQVDNLVKCGGLGYLHLEGCKVGDLSVIQKMTSLYGLTLDNCNLTSTAGIGKLTNLNSLSIGCNFNLTSIDEGIQNLTKLTSIDLTYNGLTALPDMSALTDLTSEPVYGSYGDRVRLYGNALTEEAIRASHLDNKFLGDSNWMILSTSRKYINEYGALDKYYTNLTSAYIWKQLENSNYASFATDQDVTLAAELVSEMKSSEKNVSISIINVNADYTVDDKLDYSVSSYNLANWTEADGDIELKKIPYNLIKDDSQFNGLLSGNVYGSVTIPADTQVSPFVGAQIVWNSESASDGYRILKYNGKSFTYVNNNWSGDNIRITIEPADSPREYCTYIVADQNVRIYNNSPGGYCESEIVPIDQFSVLASDDSSWQKTLNERIDAASLGDTIKMGATGWYGSFSQENYQKLVEKKIKLTIYNGWYYGANDMAVNTVRTIDFGKAADTTFDSYIVPVYYGTPYLGNYESTSYPERLFNGVKRASVGCNVPQTMKFYVGGQYYNGDKFYVYRMDYANHEAVLEHEISVNYGCIEFETATAGSYFITDEKITTTTWEEEHPPVNPGPATGGNADPEEEDKCANGHTWTSKTLTPATCTEAGVGIRTCSICAVQEEYVIPANGHNWNATYSIDKSATATEDGQKSIYCRTCGAKKPGSEVVIEKYGVEVSLPEIEVKEVNSTVGEKSAPAAVEQGQIATKSEAVDLLVEKMDKTIAPKVEVYTTGVIPPMNANLFDTASEKNKDIVLGAVNENNQLIYSWKFDYDTVDVSKVPEEGLNLAITFETEKKKEIEDLTGRTNAVYISIEGYHGELPGPATVKTYVGNEYKNGDLVYLYYYNEENKRIELVGNSGLTVKEGYVEYVLTHCSTYFVSEEEPATFGIQTNTGDTSADSTEQTGSSTGTGGETTGQQPQSGNNQATEQQTGWVNTDGVWYYITPEGKKTTGWLNEGGEWYFMNTDGSMATGWVNDGGTWYYMKSSGAMATGWVCDGGTWYYMNGNGSMATGWVNDGGTWYYMNGSGSMATGWVNDGGTWYYMNGNGSMATGWVNDGGTWYYMNGSGDMATGWVCDGGTWYYMNGSGDMATGWVYSGGKWYYMKSSGAMANGWVYTGGHWYYLYDSGAMAVNTRVGRYRIGANGVCK